jgi:predicted Zn finger-like uncharacterized protein
MYTQCPHCKTTFRIADAHLKAAKGMVRCGSCQEIFDATKHLTSGVPGETKPAPVAPAPPAYKSPVPVATTPAIKPAGAAPAIKPPPAPPVAVTNTFSFDDEEEHEHIDLTTPIPRENMPDQTPFMDSIYDENSPYNNLDKLGPIHIPGELNFGDSIIKFVDEKETDHSHIEFEEEISLQHPQVTISAKEEIPPEELTLEPLDSDDDTHPRPAINLYEDIDSKEEPTSTSERAGISDLYKFADNELTDDADLAKNIEELLTYASSLDDRASTPKPPGSNQLEDLSEFESQLEQLDVVNALPIESNTAAADDARDFLARARQDDDLDDFADLDINFDDDEEEVEEPAPETMLEQADASIAPVESDEQGVEENIEIGAVALQETTEVTPEAIPPRRRVRDEPEDDLPSAEFEIPKALRANFAQMAAADRPLGISIALGAAIILLALGFMFQLVLFRSYELANGIPALNPLLTSLCAHVPCRYSGAIDVSKIELVNRDVRSHPTQKNALLISAAFVNNAKFSQPYPTIAVKLSDLSGNIVATRHFRPEEYLENLYSKFLLMESGTPIHITLAVLDPGDDAINFEFSFLQ